MANLGDKQYNYNYYGLPDSSRVWGTAGVGGYAALTYLNMWGDWHSDVSEFFTDGIYWDHDGMQSDSYGKPLDESIALWHIPNNCSFGCNAVFSAEQGNTLKVHYGVNVHPTDVPLAMCAVDLETGLFITNPRDRWAYDESEPCDAEYSAMIYDYTYNMMCLQVNALTFDLTTPTAAPGGKELSAVASYIDADPENRFVLAIRPYIYRGATTPRIGGSTLANVMEYIPSQGSHATYKGIPLIDTLTDRPIPENEVNLRDYIKNGHNEWRDDVVYNPFTQKFGTYFFGNSSNNIQSQLEIGINRSLTVSQTKNGVATIRDTTNKITAQWYRCNYDVKDFSDVRYQWDNVIIHTQTGIELSEGFDLNKLPGNDGIRCMTRLRILDAKGNSIGKATELAIKHEVAYIGMYFTDSIAGATNSELGSGDGVGVYLPLFSGGVTTGEYVTGTDILDYPYATAGSIADDNFKYRPEESDSDSGDLTTHLHSDTIQGSTHYYALGDYDVRFLTRWLNTAYRPTDTQLTEDFKGVNPTDYIVSLKYYPFELPTLSSEILSIGGITCTVDGNTDRVLIHRYEYGKGKNSYYDLGSFPMQPPYVYGDFRDTYLKVLLYIPWCGFATLDPSLFTQSPNGTYHTISAGLSIDFATGNALGMIYRDGLLIDTINGTVGIDVPMTAVANGSYQDAIKQTEIALKNSQSQKLASYLTMTGAVAGGLITAATGNVMGAVASAGAAVSGVIHMGQINNTIEGLEYQLSHTAPSVGDISSASPFNNALSEQSARIFIFKPVMLPGADISAYARTTGHACCKQGKLSEVSRGYTECASADLSGIGCTATEKSMIFDALKKGVIV